jgi:hypothetical protein
MIAHVTHFNVCLLIAVRVSLTHFSPFVTNIYYTEAGIFVYLKKIEDNCLNGKILPPGKIGNGLCGEFLH